MSIMRTKVKLYMRTRDMSEVEALWEVLKEAEEQVADMDEKLAACIHELDNETVKAIFGYS